MLFLRLASKRAGPEQRDGFRLQFERLAPKFLSVRFGVVAQDTDEPDQLTSSIEDGRPGHVGPDLSTVSTVQGDVPGVTLFLEQFRVDACPVIGGAVRRREEFEAVLTDELRRRPPDQPLDGWIAVDDGAVGQSGEHALPDGIEECVSEARFAVSLVACGDVGHDRHRSLIRPRAVVQRRVPDLGDERRPVEPANGQFVQEVLSGAQVR